VGEHSGCERSGGGPEVGDGGWGGLDRVFGGDLGDGVEVDGDVVLGVDEEVVFGEEAGEKHSVPVFVGDFVGEAGEIGEGLFGIVPSVAELAGVGTEGAADGSVGFGEVSGYVAAGGGDGEAFESGGGAVLGFGAGVLDGGIEDAAEIGVEWGHG